VSLLTSIADALSLWHDHAVVWIPPARAALLAAAATTLVIIVLVGGSVSFLAVSSARDTKPLLEESSSSSLSKKNVVNDDYDDQKKKNNNKDDALLRVSGRRYVRAMALCTGVFLLQSILSVPVALLASESSSMAWEERLFNLSGVPSLFATTGLLWVMRLRVLETMETILAPTTTHDQEDDDHKKGRPSDDTAERRQPFRQLFEAQTSFYSNVSSILFGEVTFKIFFVLWSAIKTTLFIETTKVV
jgi:hypothetical protein